MLSRAARFGGGSLNLRGCVLQRVPRRRFTPMAWYNRHLEKTPLLTKSITSGVLFALGDVIAQYITRQPEQRFDWPRMGRAWVFGTFILGPLAHAHLNFLEWLVVKKLALKGVRMAATKMVIDQFTYFTIGINCIYLFSMARMEGSTNREGVVVVRERLWSILKVNWLVWPPVQMINFTLIPVPHQLNFVLAMSLLWASFLSWRRLQTLKS